jgi:hypothetical protein
MLVGTGDSPVPGNPPQSVYLRAVMAKAWTKRVAPAVGLFFVAPLVAEFLLGNLPINLLGVLLILAPLYGGGALLIREVVRRTDRGWPTIFVLALAFGVLEEAFTTQSLFNPNYLRLNLHLLDRAYIPALGIGGWWTVFVLTLHTVWSISTSIALVEALVPDRVSTPWLKWIGLSVTGLVFVFAVVATTSYQIKQDPFVASKLQFAASAILCVVLAVAAFRLPTRSTAREPGWVPSPWLVGFGALAVGSIFMVVPNAWGWGAVALYLLLDVVLIAAVAALCQRVGWDRRHRLALAGGAALTYAWHAFLENPAVGSGGSVDRIGNVIFAAGLVVLLFVAARRSGPEPV